MFVAFIVRLAIDPKIKDKEKKNNSEKPHSSLVHGANIVTYLADLPKN